MQQSYTRQRLVVIKVPHLNVQHHTLSKVVIAHTRELRKKAHSPRSRCEFVGALCDRKYLLFPTSQIALRKETIFVLFDYL